MALAFVETVIGAYKLHLHVTVEIIPHSQLVLYQVFAKIIPTSLVSNFFDEQKKMITVVQ